MKTIFIAALLWPLAASAHHMDVYAAYCQHHADQSKVRLVGMVVKENGTTVMQWTADRSLNPTEQQARLESKVAAVIPDWETHIFRIRKAVLGKCDRPA